VAAFSGPSLTPQTCLYCLAVVESTVSGDWAFCDACAAKLKSASSSVDEFLRTVEGTLEGEASALGNGLPIQ